MPWAIIWQERASIQKIWTENLTFVFTFDEGLVPPFHFSLCQLIWAVMVRTCSGTDKITQGYVNVSIFEGLPIVLSIHVQTCMWPYGVPSIYYTTSRTFLYPHTRQICTSRIHMIKYIIFQVRQNEMTWSNVVRPAPRTIQDIKHTSSCCD